MIKKIEFLKNEDWLSLLTAIAVILLALVVGGLPGLKFKPDSFSLESLWLIGGFGLLILIVSLPLLWVQQSTVSRHLLLIAIIFIIGIGSFYISSLDALKKIGFEYVIISLITGIIIRSIFGWTDFFKQNSYSEYFVKIGLVILGASIIFGDILKAGALGMIQALIVVISVWYFAFWVGTKLKIDEEIKIMIASAVSICGVSAAIATAGAINGDSKKLSYVISLVLIVALPMLIFQPMLAVALQLSPQVAGAWLGGTIDTTGAVVASGELLGEEALKYSTIVKFSQNILLGAAAVVISIYWALKKNNDEKRQSDFAVVWERFPKFILGFLVVSLVYSFVLQPDQVASTKDFLKSFQTVLFSIAFVCIGLETDFKALLKTGDGKPALTFIIAQSFNIILTLIISWLLFK
ncbi:MAG: putative sulfate exporter family transporter [Cytophagales bacterium]|nr:putative sulfate exporter family transporter [Cytophagales bacterium]